MLEIHQIPVLRDNYVYLAHCPDSGATAVVDPAVDAPVLAAAREKGWTITHILNTHHHADHTGGNLDIQEVTGCVIVGAACDAGRIPGIQIALKEGENFQLGRSMARIIEVPGHTNGHIAYAFEADDVLFCGDALFALGCGRVFEGSLQQMWHSLKKLRDLPDSMRVYCAHEYTQANARFAATIEMSNVQLKERIDKIDSLRKGGLPTVPSLLGEEKETNPFLRADHPGLADCMGMAGEDSLAIFRLLRRRKDNF